MINKRFGHLIVLNEADDSTTRRRKWNCLCDCGIQKSVRQDHLKSGGTTSCGCFRNEQIAAATSKPNEFKIVDDYAVVIANNTGSEFYVDLEDWLPVSARGWHQSPKGYICGRVDGKLVRLHRFIMAAPDHLQVDHVDRNPANNRRSNLRLATNSQNQMNQMERVTNKSGKRGVFWRADRNKWLAKINNKHLGHFDTFDEAVAVREKAEKEVFGEFRPEMGS